MPSLMHKKISDGSIYSSASPVVGLLFFSGVGLPPPWLAPMGDERRDSQRRSLQAKLYTRFSLSFLFLFRTADII